MNKNDDENCQTRPGRTAIRFVSHLCELLSVYHGGNLMHSPSISRVNKIQLKT